MSEEACVSENKMNRIGWIDSIKGIALVMIFIVHCVGTVIPEYSEYTVYGQYGVELFLLCSGFMSEQKSDRIENEGIFRWLVKKAYRIIPTLWLFLLITWALNYVGFEGSFHSMSHLMKNNSYATPGAVISTALCVNFVYPQWDYFSLFTGTYSLCMLVYALSYWLRKHLFRMPEAAFFTALLSFLLVVSSFRSDNAVIYYWIQYSLRGLVAFYAGVVLAQSGINNRSFTQNRVLLYSLSVGIIVLTVYNIYTAPLLSGGLFVVYASLFIVCQVVSGKTWVIWDNPFFRYIGKYSFAFYFTHPIVFYAMIDYLRGSVLLIVSFISSLLISILITEIYEKRLLRLCFISSL